jgi:hypothetical protein
MVKDPISESMSHRHVERSGNSQSAQYLKDKDGFDKQAKALAMMFHKNFTKYTDGVRTKSKLRDRRTTVEFFPFVTEGRRSPALFLPVNLRSIYRR